MEGIVQEMTYVTVMEQDTVDQLAQIVSLIIGFNHAQMDARTVVEKCVADGTCLNLSVSNNINHAVGPFPFLLHRCALIKKFEVLNIDKAHI